MKKKIFVSVTIILVLFVLLILFKSQFYRLTPEININNRIKAELFELGKKSLKSLDVPVASVIIYNDSIIGRGYNTVLRDTSAGGHSEINAISDAIKHLGIKKFNELNRDSLILISTFEPCMMCMGAIELYKIKHVFFLKGKSPFLWVKNSFGDLLYEKNKQKTGPEILQDSLFRLHPYYNTMKEDMIP
jgi:tRNA(Arg) A34 adenosine deaminase TadA